MVRLILSTCLLTSGPLLVGCLAESGPVVVVYTALDEQFSEPIFQDFESETAINVLSSYDIESSKTVGLAAQIIKEQRRPRCDLFWNNEILHTIRLQRLGLLRAYVSPVAASYPAAMRDPSGRWYGFAARARVLLVNTDILAVDERPTSIQDLLRPEWKKRVAIAKPLAGTTASHAACLFAHWGAPRAKEFFRALRGNAQVLAGNRHVSRAVARGTAAFGLTDTDDAMVEIDAAMPVAIVYPDQGEDQMGTLFIPNTLALIAGGAHPREAEQLVDYLLSPRVEAKLAQGASAQIPLNPDVVVPARVETPRTIRAMRVDFTQAADNWAEAAAFLTELFMSAD